MNAYRPKHFRLQELVGPEFYARWGERCWEWLQVPALRSLDALREKFGSVTINNWADGGTLKESGLRDFSTSTGAGYSQHKFGGAYDCKFRSATPEEAGDYILAHPEQFPYITTIENPRITRTWLHVDGRNHGRNEIWVVNP